MCWGFLLRDTSGEAVSAWFWCELLSGGFAWRHETSLWHDQKDMVLAYWRKCHKKNRYGALRLAWKDPYYPHQIVGEHEPASIWQRRYEVEWVGCRETSAVAEGVLMLAHPGLIKSWKKGQRTKGGDDDEDDDDEEEDDDGEEEDDDDDEEEEDDDEEEDDGEEDEDGEEEDE